MISQESWGREGPLVCLSLYVSLAVSLQAPRDGLTDTLLCLSSGLAAHWPSSSLLSSPPPSSSDPALLLNGVAPGGGVIVIDTVLVPFRPSWMQLYGWTVLLVGLGVVAALSLLAVVGIWLWSKRERRGVDYEPLDNEED
jgi:hypothetical protein